ncbi:bifunctional helix-turn-helix transcriptional regulator/GNAT family N-acetyltransferase [Sphingomonas immobilis]|uniref:Bifunctional helix-turn-helix transcriptional regulator/GNAT family N-acetyltransferase n=1 Tax=Sphingomonas immobilis TaxID=3063997 RepID=A0ABT9A2M5_9SPHN|nr:bifunctional helix-turn-helix transcriptional regulator/GNAT family N-acetyltransferase [Sphingomonas sp. CA1-15]MDO7844096.1 bifunctional helix-turn-helix transcriptional regulator/GNAT family N-acetyltransferase [Sphingomonas sp. CA1-15]
METTLQSVRAFNRFYTRFVGVLDEAFLGTPLSIAEARVLWEIANRDGTLATDLQEALGLDPGYTSRILRRFEKEGWIARGRGSDARRRPIALTEGGRAVFADLDERQRGVIAEKLASLAAPDRDALGHALDTARGLLGDTKRGYTIRPHRAGDMGMITARQAILYADGYDWGAPMEILLGEVTSTFLRDLQPEREACWIAESGGAMAGSIFCCDGGDGVAKLRLLYVEPWARGMGIANDLVTRCVDFARAAGYGKMTLWTHTVLTSARRIYAAHGFEIVATEIHHDFGEPVQGETWDLTLLQRRGSVDTIDT